MSHVRTAWVVKFTWCDSVAIPNLLSLSLMLPLVSFSSGRMYCIGWSHLQSFVADLIWFCMILWLAYPFTQSFVPTVSHASMHDKIWSTCCIAAYQEKTRNAFFKSSNRILSHYVASGVVQGFVLLFILFVLLPFWCGNGKSIASMCCYQLEPRVAGGLSHLLAIQICIRVLKAPRGSEAEWKDTGRQWEDSVEQNKVCVFQNSFPRQCTLLPLKILKIPSGRAWQSLDILLVVVM